MPPPMEAPRNVRHVEVSTPPACAASSRLANTTFVAGGRGPGPPPSEDTSASAGSLPCGVRRLAVWGLGLLAFSGLVMLWTSGSTSERQNQQQGKRKPSPSAAPSSCPSAPRAYSSKSTNTDASPEPLPPQPPSSSRQADLRPDAAGAVIPPSSAQSLTTTSILACKSPKPPGSPDDATCTVKDLPPPLVQLALVDQSLESMDRSTPLSLYTSLVAAPSPASELAIRRSVSWSEPYLSSDEHSDDDLLCTAADATATTTIVHRLDRSERKPSLRDIAASDMPIFHSYHKTSDSDALPVLPSSTIITKPEAASSKSTDSPAAADGHGQSYTPMNSRRCSGVNWTQVKIDLFLLICILSFLLYFFYFRSRQESAHPKEIQIPKAATTVPFPLYRLLP